MNNILGNMVWLSLASGKGKPLHGIVFYTRTWMHVVDNAEGWRSLLCNARGFNFGWAASHAHYIKWGAGRGRLMHHLGSYLVVWHGQRSINSVKWVCPILYYSFYVLLLYYSCYSFINSLFYDSIKFFLRQLAEVCILLPIPPFHLLGGTGPVLWVATWCSAAACPKTTSLAKNCFCW